MVEVKSVFNKAIEHVVNICTETLDHVDISQDQLIQGLDELEKRLQSISDLQGRLNSNKISEAHQSIEIYKAKLERIKARIFHLKKRITNIETRAFST